MARATKLKEIDTVETNVMDGSKPIGSSPIALEGTPIFLSLASSMPSKQRRLDSLCSKEPW